MKSTPRFDTIGKKGGGFVKKTSLSIAVILLCALLLCACGAAAQPELPVEPTETPAGSPAPVETPAASAVPVPTETPAAEPAETSLPMPTEEPGLPLSLSHEEQYEANIFLSNFSEQSFGLGRFTGFDSSRADEAQLYAFAHLWAKINRQSAIFYEDSYEAMTLESVNEILERFFGLGIHPEDGTEYSEVFGIGNFDWDHSWYRDGIFYYPAGDGESYTCFTVVDAAESLSGSRTRFRFTVYELDLDIYYDKLGIPQDYYRLTPGEAAQRVAVGEITPLHTGTAVCESCYLQSSGRESYRLDTYLIDETE